MRAIIIAVALLVAAPLRATTRLSLKDAVELAKCRRSEMLQADIDVQLGALNVLRAKLERVHLVIATSFNEQYQKIDWGAPAALCTALSADCGVDQEGHIFNANASLQVPLWSGFTVEADLAYAKAMHRASRADRESKVRALVREVTAAYWAVRRAEMLLELGRIALKRNEEIAALVKARADHGIVSMVDYNRAQTMVLSERSQIASLEEQVEAARTELAATLQINDTVELTDQPVMTGPPLPSLPELLAQAQSRPEIKLTQAHVEAGRERVRSVKGQLWPQVSLFANAGVGNIAVGVPQNSIIGNVTAGIGVNWTIFDMLTTWNNVREAEYLSDRAALDRVRIDFTVAAEVRVAYVRLKKAIERRDSIVKALALSVSTVDLIRKRYLTGTSLLIEVLSAESELLQLESQATDNAVEIADARAQLWHASGQP
jgi:outer membrane protein